MRLGLVCLSVCLASPGCLQREELPATRTGKRANLTGKAKRVKFAKVRTMVPGHRKRWDARGSTKMGEDGLDVQFEAVRKPRNLQIQRSNASGYDLTYFNGTLVVGKAKLHARKDVARDRFVVDTVKTPPNAKLKGFDRVRMVPFTERRYSLGGIKMNVGGKGQQRGAKQRMPQRRKGGKPGGAKRGAAPGAQLAADPSVEPVVDQ